MNREKLSITIASSIEKDNLCTELWDGDNMWGELEMLNNCLTLIIYPHPSGRNWEFSLPELREILQQAEEAVLSYTNYDPPQ